MTLSPLKVAVLAGGPSAERDVSLASAKAIEGALKALGHTPHMLDVTPTLAQDLASAAPDVVFNALHGRSGEDGVIQGFLETLGYRYTHSGVASSAIAMDKKLTKIVLAGSGIDFPADFMVTPADLYAGDPMARPFVVKSPNEGSSVSVVIVTAQNTPARITPEVEGPWTSYDRLMVEEYIPGTELSVAVLNGAALGVIELRPTTGFYDYKAKYTDGVTEHLMPAPVSAEIAETARAHALAAHEGLGCKGVTRSDFRYDRQTGRLAFLEINTQPGMTQLSIVPEIAAHAGLDFNALISAILEDAVAPS